MVSFTVFKGSENLDIVKSTTTREVAPDEVLIKVSHSGVCGTDEHHRHRNIVLGHEGAGIIEVSTSSSPLPISPQTARSSI
jgi:D-arabinose 1-dehydrogenase-like Zn-dependent alcohol dehydrogenase